MKGTSVGSWFGSTYGVCLAVQYFEGVSVTLDLNRLYQDGWGKPMVLWSKSHNYFDKIPPPRGGIWGLYMNPKVRPEKNKWL